MNEKRGLEMSEVEVQIKDIVIECARKIKLVAIFAIACASVLLGFGVLTSKDNSETKTIYTYEEVCNMLQPSQIVAVENLVALTEQQLFLNDYITDADKMQIDYYQEKVAYLQYYIDIEDKNLEKTIVTLYHNYISKGGLAKDIALETEDVRYLSELIVCFDTAEEDEEVASAITIAIITDSEEYRSDLVARVKDKMQDYANKTSVAVGEHKITIIDEIYKEVIDNTTRDHQSAQLDTAAKLAEKIQTEKAKLTGAQLFLYNYKLGNESEYVVSNSGANASYIKYIVLGCAMGIVLSIFVIIIQFIFDKTIKNQYEAQKMYSVRNLGFLWSEKVSKYQKLLDEVKYGKGVKNCAGLLRVNMMNALKDVAEEKVAVIGIGGEGDFELVSDTVIQNDDRIVWLGDVLNDTNALTQVPNYKNAIVVLKERGTTYVELYRILLLCEQEEINVVGYMTLR